jgi:4-diphosphocytidyl-2C-methyl-D-erythritol kinase
VKRPRDLAALPPNDLASSPLADELRAEGAFRADVSGAGPTVYGLFHHRAPAEAARRRLSSFGRAWLTIPAWYG